MLRVLIACGGTGGHLAPGIAIAEEILHRNGECQLVISRKQVDSRLCQKYKKLKFVSISGRPFSISPLRFISFAFSQFLGLSQSLILIRRVKPHMVIAFGSFVSAGLVLAAFFCGVPVVLHEANRNPGRATRVLARFACRLFLPEGVSLSHVSDDMIRHYGFPLRKEISKKPQDQARRHFGLPLEGKLVAVIGGSQGAQILNDWVKKHQARFSHQGIHILCVTGMGKGAEEMLTLKGNQGQEVKTLFIPFTDAMAEVLSAADLVISRAGAGSIAEIIECQVPSILMPYPYAADQHQKANASYLESRGGCILIDQKEIHRLINEVLKLLDDDCLLQQMRKNLSIIQIQNKDISKRMLDDLELLVECSDQKKKVSML